MQILIKSRLFDLEHNFTLWLIKITYHCPKDLNLGGRITYINNSIFKT